LKNLQGIQKWCDLSEGKLQPYMSASKLNQFRNDLPMFVCKYGFGMKTKTSAPMQRGLIVEKAVVEVLTKTLEIDEAITLAESRFTSKFPLIADESIAKEFKSLEPFIRNSVEALEEFGCPEFDNGDQERIKFTMKDTVNDWEVDFIGFLDLVYPDGTVIDLKTTHRMPSTQSYDHQLQRAIYQMAKSNHSVKFCYVTPRGFAFKEDGDVTQLMEEARLTVNRMNKFCEKFTPEEARQCIPQTNTFYWTGENELKEFYNQEKESI